MRLPQGKRLGVQSLGRNDINAPMRQWSAEQKATQAMTGAIQGALRIGAQIYETDQADKARDASLAIKKELDIAHMKANTHENYDLNNMEDRAFLEGTQYKETNFDGSLRENVPQDEVMAQAWTANRDRIMKDRTAKMSKSQQRRITESLTPHIDSLDLNTQRNSIRATSEGFQRRAIEAADDQVAAGDINSAVQVIADAPYFNDQEKEDHIDRLRINHETGQMDQVIFGDDPQAIVDLIIETEPENYEGMLSPRKLEAYRNDMVRAHGKLTAEQTAAEEQEKATAASDLEIAVSRGELAGAAINRAYEEGTITAAKRTQLTKMADAFAGRAVKTANAKQSLSEFMQGKGTYNPTNTKHKAMTEDALEGVEDIEGLEQISHELGYVPKFLKDKVEGGALRGNGAEALQIYSRMVDGKPQLLSQINADAKSILNTAAGYVRTSGMSPQDALTHARELLQVPPEQRESRSRDYARIRASTEEDGNLAALEDLMDEDKTSLFKAEGMLFGDSWISEVEPSRQQLEEFEYLTQKEFIKFGDINIARGNAYQQSRSVWGTSGVGGQIKDNKLETGRRSTKYSPERMMNQTTEQVNETLETFAMVNGLDKDNLILKDTPNTARGAPEWRVYAWNEETKSPDPLIDNNTGQPLVFNAANYEEFKKDLLEIQGMQEAYEVMGLVDEWGDETEWAVRKHEGEVSAQRRIDEIMDEMESKPKQTQYRIAERIVGNKNASPDQIQRATDVMQKYDKARSESKGMGGHGVHLMPQF